MDQSNKSISWTLLTILAVGGFFRFYGITGGGPFSFHIDEWHVLRDALEMYHRHSPRPPDFDYPSFPFYFHMGMAWLISWFTEPSLFLLHIAGRVSSAFFGTASIAAVYLLGNRAYGSRTGLLAAAFYACMVTPLREAHFATVDTLNVFFIILALYFILRIAAESDSRPFLFAGVAIGLAGGTKYNGALLFFPLCLALLVRGAPSSTSFRGMVRGFWSEKSVLWSRQLFLIALVALTVFLLTTPFAILDAKYFIGFLAGKLFRMSAGLAPWNHHYFGTIPYLYFIENLLFWGMGPVLEAACLFGLAYVMFRRRKQDLVLAGWCLLYFAFVGGWFNKASRYALPMLPCLAITGAVFFVEMREFFAGRGKRFLCTGSAVLASMVLVSGLLYSLAFVQIYACPHTGIQALRWSLTNIPEGSTILLEPTPWERPPIDGGVALVSTELTRSGPGRFRFKYLDVFKFADGQAGADSLRILLNQTLEEVDTIVMSIRWCEGFIKSPVASSVIRNHYRTLLEGTGDFVKVAEFTSYPRLWGFEWRDDWAELNFRIFDHPKVMVFQRRHVGG